MICVSLGGLTPATVGPALAPLRGPDLRVEIRLDLSPAPVRSAVLREAARLASVPLVATCRPVEEGGRYQGGEEERLRLLQQAAEGGYAFVDCEFGAGRVPDLPAGTGLILSHHDFVRTPPGLVRLLRRMEARAPALVKVCTTARSLGDNLRMVELLRAARRPAVGLCMGELGRPTRILYRVLGGAMTYAAPGGGAETAPGQIALAELRDRYRAARLGPRTRIYGLLGWPVGHSRSPAFFNSAFAAAARDAVYVPFAAPAGRELARWVRAFPAHGYSVTIPHKEAALALSDRASADAQAIGAANTLRLRAGRWEAFNTDWRAAMAAIEEAASGAGWGGVRPLRGRPTLVLGAGGAARGLAYGLARAGARVTVTGRTATRARRLAGDLGVAWIRWEQRASGAWQVLANTTPLGMAPERTEDTPFPKTGLRPGTLVFDAVYQPPETRLLREAAAAGCIPVAGTGMFERQARAQLCLWFPGKTAPPTS